MRTNQDDKDQQSALPGRVHGYVRVSTPEQAGDDRLSLSIQEQEIREKPYAAASGETNIL